MHIRRTDKVAAEAAFHKLDEYMTHVERYFDRVDLGRSEPSNRAIYMASDDPNVFTEAATKLVQLSVVKQRMELKLMF